jgi:hypothetical protein
MLVYSPADVLQALSEGVDATDPHAPIRALRRLKHERLQKKLFRLDKDARLRSGARGMQARKALVAFEKVVAESNTLYEPPPAVVAPL